MTETKTNDELIFVIFSTNPKSARIGASKEMLEIVAHIYNECYTISYVQRNLGAPCTIGLGF
jgi:hypothetical protein